MKWIVSFLILAILTSCSPTKIAKRKYRKAQKLMEEAGRIAPNLADTVWILERDTIMLTKDSLRTEIKLTLDSGRVDSLIDKIVQLREQGLETRTITKMIYEEVIPDLNYASVDSLPIVLDGVTTFIRYDINITIKDDLLKVVTKPINNIPIVTQKAVVTIDARKMGRFWKGVMWGSIGTLLILVALWFLKGIIGTALKTYIG